VVLRAAFTILQMCETASSMQRRRHPFGDQTFDLISDCAIALPASLAMTVMAAEMAEY
jgi:hypothetical protein